LVKLHSLLQSHKKQHIDKLDTKAPYIVLENK